jgi:flagellar biosynthesis/type III secretory pathway protein FliH
MKEETKELLDVLETEIDDLESHAIKADLEIQKRATFAQTVGVVLGVLIVLFCLGGVVYMIYQSGYEDGYKKGQDVAVRSLLPVPDQQEWQRRFHCDVNGCVEIQ